VTPRSEEAPVPDDVRIDDFMRFAVPTGHPFVRDGTLWIQLQVLSDEVVTAVRGDDEFPAPVHALRRPQPAEYRAGHEHPAVVAKQAEAEDVADQVEAGDRVTVPAPPREDDEPPA